MLSIFCDYRNLLVHAFLEFSVAQFQNTSMNDFTTNLLISLWDTNYG